MHVVAAHDGWPTRNLVLSAVPADDRPRLHPYLKLVAVRSGQTLYRAAERITHLYFPLDSAIAKFGVDRTGGTAEYVLIGKEGLVGLDTLLGEARATGHAVVQLPGYCYRADTAPVMQILERSPVLRRAILRYVSSRVFQIQQSSLCNTRHSLDQRLCRWILQALDCVGRRELRVTHELIGRALGLRREAVTNIALRLQAQHAIRCGRGHIDVLDRAALEARSCECYAALKSNLDALAREVAAM
jgi:CRP-like cAMP-binding protein